jgi:long-subunit acyl-CoA synthetase (AMP-forming)
VSSAAAAKVSPGQEESSVPSTLAGLCLQAIARHDKPDAVSEKRDGQWVRISAVEFVRRVRHIALGLADLGIQPRDPKIVPNGRSRISLFSVWARSQYRSTPLNPSIKFSSSSKTQARVRC